MSCFSLIGAHDVIRRRRYCDYCHDVGLCVYVQGGTDVRGQTRGLATTPQDYLHKAQVEEIVCVYIFPSFGMFMLLSVYSPALHNIYFIHLRYDIAYLC